MNDPNPTTEGRFIEFTFEGGRFAEHTIPVELLAEIAAFQELIETVARSLFLTQNPGRKRVPSGFSNSAQIHFSKSKDNCFTAVTKLVVSRDKNDPHADPTLFPEQEKVDGAYFRNARDLCLEALTLVGDGGDPPANFPKAGLHILGAFGRRLLDEEYILVRGKFDKAARVDQETRTRIAKFTKRPLIRVDRLDGEVERFDDKSGRAVIRTKDRGLVEIPVTEGQRNDVCEALLLRPTLLVRVHGELIFGNQPCKMERIDQLQIVDHERAHDINEMWAHLKELGELEDGWLDGTGVVPNQDLIGYARSVLSRVLADRPIIQRPRLYPTPDGGILAEWTIGKWSADVEFVSDGESVIAGATQCDSGESRREQFTNDKTMGSSAKPIGDWLEAICNRNQVKDSPPDLGSRH